MRSVEQTLADMGKLSETDVQCVSDGFDSGNYIAAYDTHSYGAAVETECVGTNGFYRVGFLLGFFSSLELHEVPSMYADDVEHYRAVSRAQDWGFAD